MPDSCRASPRRAIAGPAGILAAGVICLLALTGNGRPGEATTIPDLAGPWMRTGNAFDFGHAEAGHDQLDECRREAGQGTIGINASERRLVG